MGTTALMKNSRRVNTVRLVSELGLVIFAFMPFASSAADIGGGIRVGASYTDNVRLDPSSSDIDDVIYQASPWLNFVHESPQLSANAEYGFDWYRYSSLSTTSNYDRGQASLFGRAWNDSLTAELGARRSQTLNDPDDVIPQGQLPLTSNLIDQDEWWVSPRLRRILGSAITLDAGYRYAKVQFGDPLVQDNTNHTGDFSIENYNAGSGLTWALRYNWFRTEYEISAPWENQKATAELGFWINDNTRVFGASGKESSWDTPFDPALQDPFWEAGFAFSPNDNLSFEFAAGERSFGSSWRGNLDYTFRRGNLSLSYDEAPTTTGFSRPGGTISVLDPDILDDYLNRPGSAERYVSSRLDLDLTMDFRRTSVGVAVFSEDRSDRFRADGSPAEDQTQTGARANLTWRAGVRTAFSVSGSSVDQETGVGNKSKLLRARIDANYNIGRRASLSLGYSYSEQEPRGPGSSSRDYVANIISLFFTFTFADAKANLRESSP